MIQIRRILVPIDFSPPAQTALDYAKSLASEFDSELFLLHVIATPEASWGAEAATYSWPSLIADLEKDATAELNRLVPSGDPLAGRVTKELAVGVPVTGILDFAETHQIDLIVMGTHGRGTVGHLLLGSVAERVVRRSPVPVLTLHQAPTHLASAEQEEGEALGLAAVPS
jgi:nucleotide-binding universal stress UspA family protein